jgi:hypothetical protein
MIEINKNYVAGYLENIGCFYSMKVNNRKNKIPQFKIVIQQSLIEKIKHTKKIIKFLSDNYEINLTSWNDQTQVVWQTTSMQSLKNLINFINDNCFLEKKNIKEVIKIINTRKKS